LPPHHLQYTSHQGIPEKLNDTTFIFKNVTLIIRANEAIPVNYLLFEIYKDNNRVAYVNFTLHGTENDDPSNAFEVIKLSNTSQLPYNDTWGYGYDEITGNETNYDYGYGYGPSGSTNLSIVYNIKYTTQNPGTYYGKLIVDCEIYTYISDKSTTFTIQQPYNGGGGGDPPPPENEPPFANAGGPYKGKINTPITFDGSQSTDDVAVVGYRWDWENDGIYDTNWSTSPFATHTYIETGVYIVRLQVKDGENLTHSATSIATINGNDVYAPVAHAGGPYRGLTYQDIRFDGSASYGINASIVNYTWVFGDGTTGYGQSPVHAYETAGTFIVILTVTDSKDLQAIDTTTARILLDANRNNIPDIMEETIGTPITEEDILLIFINGDMYYLVDTNQDGIYDVLYNPTTNTKSTLGQQNGKQLIDIDGDGLWDYVYDPVLGTTSPYEGGDASLDFPWLIAAIIAISIISLIALVWLYRTGWI
jgi:PKD repeat protein